MSERDASPSERHSSVSLHGFGFGRVDHPERRAILRGRVVWMCGRTFGDHFHDFLFVFLPRVTLEIPLPPFTFTIRSGRYPRRQWPTSASERGVDRRETRAPAAPAPTRIRFKVGDDYLFPDGDDQ